MKTKIQIKSIFGKLLFEYENEENSIEATLLKALETRADLRGADLTGRRPHRRIPQRRRPHRRIPQRRRPQ